MSTSPWSGVLLVCVVLLGVLGLSAPFVKQSSATFVIIQLGAIHLVAAILIIGSLIYFDWDPFSALR